MKTVRQDAFDFWLCGVSPDGSLVLIHSLALSAALFRLVVTRSLHGRQECVVPDLDCVDVQDALRRRDESEVDDMRQRPSIPSMSYFLK